MSKYSSLELITEKSVGMNNEITGCGILDYEFEDSVKNRYQYTNFYPGIIIVTSFLYAKDNEFLLMDAIKTMINQKCSGLVNKNVYQLEISSNIIKYANKNNFPIFIMRDQSILFQDFIFDIHKLIEKHASTSYFGKKIEYTLNNDDNGKSIIETLQELNPFLETVFIAVYFRFKKLPKETEIFGIVNELNDKLVFSEKDSIVYYKKGFLLVHSATLFENLNIDDILKNYESVLVDLANDFYISVSDVCHDIKFFGKAVNEAFYTSLLAQDNKVYCKYGDLGTFKLVITCKNCFDFEKFSQQFTDKLVEHDLEFGTEFLETALSYILSNGDLEECSLKMNVHINTIRYRLNNLSKVLNYNIFNKSDYEQISIAIKIHYFKIKHDEFERLYGLKLQNHYIM